ncbi:DUF427 domain-containing protein [Actinobacteria bacterium YIM 96077]|uniref:DUF427 domain-containing protein n=1 Tax=Phytoactinopolyspora halophila TaxID=1981511 RepID=A0A329QYS8_9ACTN|nr:DUF427 domain-containing protein [Phytoactinopolyspora halophila]AYY13221.1 DUF427 domain-containing protein [Actinobacteria bacterium YIM 96077]RAW17540.1 hypothetical protein DPM12_05980 [Phytoactinopolyspora halophila]
MVRAIWNGAVVAESDETTMVEGQRYFPPGAINPEYFTATRTRTLCPWKGIASYYTVSVDGVELPDAAWSYRRPFPLARKIKKYVAFYGGIEIVDEEKV